MSTYNDASLIYYPSGYKASKAYSLKPTDGSGDLTFTRASTATRVNEQGLIEGVRTNLILQSNTFSDASWNKVAQGVGSVSVVTPNYTTDPFGGNNAWRFQCNLNGGTTSNDRSWMLQSFTPIANSILSIYIKLNVAGSKTIILSNGGGNVQTITSTDWVRINIATSGSSGQFRIGLIGNATSDTLDCSIAFAQAEVSDFGATEYIPTTTTAVSVGMLANVPRIDYTGGGCGKLLLEPQRTNLIKNSANVGAGFVVTNITLVLNNAAAPNGLVEADKFYPNTSGSYRWFYQAVTTSASCTISVFAKADGKDILYISEGSLADVSFDLSSGLVIFERSGWVGSIEDFGDGWYRCIAVKSSSVSFAAYGVADIGGSNTVTASGTDGILVWGMQCESSATYPTSYIPTSGTAVTRVADSASKTGISALIGQTEGTFFVDFEYNSTKPETTYFSIDDVAGNNRILIYGVTTPKIYCLIQVGGSTQAVFSFDPSANTRYKIAVGYKVNDFTAYVNGSQIGSDLSGSVTWTAPLSRFTFNAVVQYNAQKINSAIIIPTRLSNAELATLTTL